MVRSNSLKESKVLINTWNLFLYTILNVAALVRSLGKGKERPIVKYPQHGGKEKTDLRYR